MTSKKLSSDEVPEKFTDWLLSMGCPVEQVSIEELKQKCRGQYYMVWRSLMEHAQAKNIIQEKKLHVFCADIKICQQTNSFTKDSASIFIPEQRLIWDENKLALEKLTKAEMKISQDNNCLKELMHKRACKIIQRDTIHSNIEDVQRRSWLLRQVKSNILTRKADSEKVKEITMSFCSNLDADQDIQTKLDKYLSQHKRSPSSNPMDNLSTASLGVEKINNKENEDHMTLLLDSTGEALWPHLCQKRSGIVDKLIEANTKVADGGNNGFTQQSVLAHTAALHCNITLEVMKNRIHLSQIKKRFAESLDEIGTIISSELSELVVVQCEKASAKAKVNTFKTLLEEIKYKIGIFSINAYNTDDGQTATSQMITNIDKNIEKTREDLKRLLLVQSNTERKIDNLRESLIARFNAFHNDSEVMENERCPGIDLDFPDGSFAVLKKYYADICEKNKVKAATSLDLDVLGQSYYESFDTALCFSDELKTYLNKFNLEKNRKFILDSGEKIRIFETLQAQASKLNTKWLSNEAKPLLCPSVSLSQNIQQLINKTQERDILNSIVKRLNVNEKNNFNIDITPQIEHEASVTDKIKKKISENILSIQKINRILDVTEENLHFWSKNPIKDYMPPEKTVQGKMYEHYEAYYVTSLKFNGKLKY